MCVGGDGMYVCVGVHFMPVHLSHVISFNYPAKSTETIEADHHLKLVFTFELVNSKTGDAVSVHQVTQLNSRVLVCILLPRCFLVQS